MPTSSDAAPAAVNIDRSMDKSPFVAERSGDASTPQQRNQRHKAACRPDRQPVGYFAVSGKVPVSRRSESRVEGPGNPLLPVRPPSSLKQPEAVVDGAGFRFRAVCVAGGIAS